MAEDKEKAVEKDQVTNPPAGAKKDDLSDNEAEKVVGGASKEDYEETIRNATTVLQA